MSTQNDSPGENETQEQSEQDAPRSFDVVIAGGGVTGLLAASRLSQANPQLKIALIEKEGELGGRLRSTAAPTGPFSYGLNAISPTLYDFWNQTLKNDPEAPDLPGVVSERQKRVGVLAAKKVSEFPVEEWFSSKGAKKVGGAAAARSWDAVEELVGPVVPEDHEDEEAPEGDGDTDESKPRRAGATSEKALGQAWKKTRKDPAAVVMEHFGNVFGIPDIWNASPGALAERAAFHGAQLYKGPWEPAIQALTDRESWQNAVTVFSDCHIIQAKYENETWHLDTSRGAFTAPKMVVAQPPWQAILWLPRSLWPADLLALASKTKPVSAVVLSEKLLTGGDELPDVTMVPAEKCQVVKNGADEICYQATIDYEMSLQAPAVVKAVKALRRARKKLMAACPELSSEGDHIALQPVAWSQSPMQRDRRWLSKLRYDKVNQSHLVFCGDAYGPRYDGDSNIVKSLLAACESLGSGSAEA